MRQQFVSRDNNVPFTVSGSIKLYPFRPGKKNFSVTIVAIQTSSYNVPTINLLFEEEK